MVNSKQTSGSRRGPIVPHRPGDNLPSKQERHKSGDGRGNAPPRNPLPKQK
jgi:hypothetical protein